MLLDCQRRSDEHAAEATLEATPHTVERTRVDPPEDALRGKEHVHAITEPVRQDQQEESGDEEGLGLEVVDLSKHTVARNMLETTGYTEECRRDSRAESGKTETKEERPEGDGLESRIVVGR